MKSIQWRLVFIYLTLVLIVMISSGTFILWQIERYEYNKIYVELKEATDIIQNNFFSSQGNLKSSWNDLNTLVWDGNFLGNKKLYILDSYGNIKFPDSQMDEERWNKRVVYEAKLNKEPSMGRPINVLEGSTTVEYVDYASPILSSNSEVLYIIYIRASTQEIADNIAKITNIILIASIGALFITMVFGIYFSKTLTAPIKVLTKRAKEMAEGRLDCKIEVKSNDEIGQLTGSFNHMAEELNQMLLAISSEKNKLETVISNMTDGILAFDRKGMLIQANPAAYTMLKTDTMEKYFYDIFKKAGLELRFDEFIKMKPNSIKQHIMMIGDRYINACFAAYGREKGEIEGIIIVLQDVTEQKELEEMRKEFVANVSHELRTPLTTIKSYTETLLDGALEEKEVAIPFLEVINNETDRMTALVQDLLELSRLDNKQVKFNKRSINLIHLIEDSVNKHKIHAQKKQQNMQFNTNIKKLFINIDPDRIYQVFSNILSNAIKYSPEKASINIGVLDNEDNVRVFVKDTGIGISKEDLPRIFERFYRVDKARSRAMGGTGLGLAIAKEIMENHNGKIWAESEKGKGTTIILEFPKNN
ncbi:ATP-binding protein [Defluviitalea phaphyphila]|uniref:ATP-binding protein n=1 Tax=Defluviitalea phaphyphila TaxID=1473580 RepID=UPI000730AD43|nr:ATP-binding protein [Defluviitalea phaphyphila]